MFTNIIEFTALVLFGGCLWHAARYHGRGFAQQWFIGGYLAAILRETLMQVAFGVYIYVPSLLMIGTAPALITLLSPTIYYLAWRWALRFVPRTNLRRVLVLVFLIASSLALPLEATAVQAHWWVYVTPSRMIFGGIPPFAPLMWGGAAAIFYAVFARVARTLLPERGKLYAMITLAPIIAALQLIWILLLSVVIG